MRSRHVFGLVVVCSLSVSASADFIWDEGSFGDLSNDPAKPTVAAFGLGGNYLVGSVQATDDTRDYVTFTINPGEALTNLRLLRYFGEFGEPVPVSFHAINAGATSFIPSPATASSFLGGAHLSFAPSGTDVLPGLAAATAAGSGFSIPLGAGTYSYLIQQTGPELTGYSLEFTVSAIPAPASLATLAPLFLARRRR